MKFTIFITKFILCFPLMAQSFVSELNPQHLSELKPGENSGSKIKTGESSYTFSHTLQKISEKYSAVDTKGAPSDELLFELLKSVSPHYRYAAYKCLKFRYKTDWKFQYYPLQEPSNKENAKALIEIEKFLTLRSNKKNWALPGI